VAIQKKIKGVVIDGAIRDTEEIRRLNFPAFVKLITSAAGEPKGFGEIGAEISCGNQKVRTGDWVIGEIEPVHESVFPQPCIIDFIEGLQIG